MNAACILVASALLSSDPAFTGDANFIVCAPNRECARAVLAAASDYRREIAMEWFGRVPPDGEHVTIIHVTLDGDDYGATWPPPDGSNRTGTLCWIHGTADTVTGATLRHEVAHMLLRDDYPSWVSEGIACHYDDGWRRERWHAWQYDQRTADRVVSGRRFHVTDLDAYAAAYWLVRYHASREGKITFLKRVRIER